MVGRSSGEQWSFGGQFSRGMVYSEVYEVDRQDCAMLFSFFLLFSILLRFSKVKGRRGELAWGV